MTNLTQPSSLRPADSTAGTHLRGSLKGALALLALVLLGLLLWQLFAQFRHTQDDLRQQSLATSAELADHLSLNMALKAQQSLNLVQPYVNPPAPAALPSLLATLQARLPALRDLAWLDATGQVRSDTLAGSPDRQLIDDLLQLNQGRAFFYGNDADNQRVYLLLRQPTEQDRGYWLLRLSPDHYQELTRHLDGPTHPLWLLENSRSGAVIERHGDRQTSEEPLQSVMLAFIDNSTWQLRGLFDAGLARDRLLPALLGKCVLVLFCALLPVLALINMRRRQRALQEDRRRYQEIFEGTGVALCVLDLSSLPGQLDRYHLRNRAALKQSLALDTKLRRSLLTELKITEINQVARQLLNVDCHEGAWQRLIDGSGDGRDSVGMQLIDALIEERPQLELEVRLPAPLGGELHLWLMARLPQQRRDYQAVILSISDITSRKQVELSLLEREGFWSDVVRTVPDQLYVQDVDSQRMIFSNRHLGQTLGYDRAELAQMGDRFWEMLLHPGDAEHYRDLRQQQRDTGYGQSLHCQLRFRHRDGGWRCYDIREQVLTRDSEGLVTRIIGVGKDVTVQIEASESLRDSEQRYRMLAESISDVIFSTDSQLQLNYVSPSVQAVLGYQADWIFANGWQSIIANPAQLSGVYNLLERVSQVLDDSTQLAQLRSTLPTQLFLFDCLRADGRKIPIELRLVLVWDEHERFEGVLGVGRDISQQRRAEKDLRMAATVFEHSTSAILITDPAGYIVQANEAFTRVSGYAVAEVLDQLPGMLTVEQQQNAQQGYVLKQLSQRGSWEGEVWLKRRNGEHYPAWVGITAVLDDEGDLASYVCFFTDISERKASEQRIHRLAYYDALTHLPNRTLFQDRLYTALQQAERQKAWVVLMFLDLDRFKPINDSLGHAAGDRMLKDMAERLLACVDDDDTVARMGGDEFTLLLQPKASREQALNRAIHVAEHILDGLVTPFVLENREFFVTASIGIALSPQDGSELSQLMKNADTAMYHAKERGKNNFQFYQADMNASALERLELESDLRHALEQNEFILYYQPQFSGDGKRLTGAEALLRWRHPTRGLVPPGDFIPVIEELGLVVDVGDWVLREASRQLKAWHQQKVRVPKVSVNISARQFSDGQLGTRIATILDETGLPPACLELELTESILMREVNEAMQILDSLKNLGLSIAVDDFGTGYSSLNYLKQFPIDVLKIDRTFVDGLPEGEQDAQIARAIIAMAHSLNLAVIAEGVETHEQLEFLREHGCDEVQGYLFGRPMPANQFEAQFSNETLFMFQ
ncbi:MULTISPECIES: GGDEF and EAL domain-containing protein [unclassified Pseudomonas]|uniref:sensor domain-containing protein n=1 Tax=unclassified Pseudomonas TaxID=196821 RepID=UPI000C888ECA|nr:MULTISPECIES: GGDEF and EAL domain-containing protein [unclassified Pseudomonas]PMZ95102.1 diguanylate phosphodiesterase [Pseudomonas sp. FW305-42]PNA19834.1 diguanylate phosphodiesterase [Pseudomonas sp. MPR-R1B]PNB24577.1 diguanylate phosphodiesterase [Pseudomonas sp. DP16D-E2]PNB40539.1 diguanylate phosphodiesterase [Pseudomonas sp. FW305-17]PNB58174.1 diguanylate phosphodiesterase [Pseudomonas sp. GW531-E2]